MVLLALAAELATSGARPCQSQTTGPAVVCIFPAGGQRGTTVEATVIGEGLLGATDVYVAGSGVTGKITGEEKTTAAPRPPGGGKAEQPPKPWNNAQVATHRVRLSIAIAPDAAPGPRNIRLVTPTGLTSRVRFLVDELPEVVITQPNDSPATAAPLASLPVVANGQIYSGWIGSIAIRGTPDRGYYRVAAKAGQTLVCQVQARELIPFIDQAVPGFLDACVTLRDPAGRRLGYADDFRFSPDPILVHKVEQDGEYLLEVRDVIYRSHHDFVYRMRLGSLPWLTHAFPLGGRRNTDVQLELHGVNLPDERLAVKIPADASDVHWATVQRDGLRSNALPLAVDDLPEAIETEPNDAPAAAQAIAVPVVINGRIQAPGDADHFAFQAEAGQTLALEVSARRLGSPLDSILTLYDSTGRKLAEHDDPAPQAVPNALGTGVENDSGASIDPRDALVIHRADARLVHTFDSAGKYVLRIGDVTDQGGQEYAYRLKIAPAEKDFALRVKTGAANVVQGDSALVAVDVFRRNGFDGPVRVEVQGLPAGFVASEAIIPAGQNDGQLTLSAPADAATGLHTPQVLGKADVDGRPVRREGIPLETVGQAFYIKHMLPTEGFLLHVGKQALYTLSSDAPPGKELAIPRKGDLKIVVKAARLEGGKGQIALGAAGLLPQGIVVRPAILFPGVNEATISVTAAPKAAADTAFNLVISGTMRIGPGTVTRTLPAIPVRVSEN